MLQIKQLQQYQNELETIKERQTDKRPARIGTNARIECGADTYVKSANILMRLNMKLRMLSTVRSVAMLQVNFVVLIATRNHGDQ